MAIRALLLQARRPDDSVAGEERASFAARMGSSVEIDTHDLLTGPPEPSALEPYDLLMIGGSGDFYVSKGNLPRFGDTLEFFRRVADRGFPTFASCFGFQCLVAALGGEIVHDAESTEVGTYELRLTEAGRADPLLGDLPDHFSAQMGRKDRAASLPDGVVHLASSERCPYQALRIPGKPIWATQFHPELTGDENRRRFFQYIDGYAVHMTDEEREAASQRFHDSPSTAGVLVRFLDILRRGRY